MALSSLDELKQTPLHLLHNELNARMVPFAGYAMPVQFEGVKAEHLHTRQNAGLFDVSHMGQILIQGKSAAEKLEALVPVDLIDLPINKQIYTLLTNDQGGIRDDLMISRLDEDAFFLVVNAACKEADLAWLQEQLTDLSIEYQEDKALIALQGPAAANVLCELFSEIESLTFMNACSVTIEGITAYITRSGYTGEDGFEISLPASIAENFTRQLLNHDAVKPVGLGARDTLRLEAGMCLYGHDMDETITPVAANLSWSISKVRQKNGSRAGGFPGADIILNELAHGTESIRVGLKVEGRAPVREGAELVDDNNCQIGRVTSGGFGPSVNAPIAMGYVETALSQSGTQLNAMVRSKPLPVTVTPLPFVPNNYVR